MHPFSYLLMHVQGKLLGYPSLGLYMYNNEMVGQPPPAHTGIPPLHVDPKTGTTSEHVVYLSSAELIA